MIWNIYWYVNLLVIAAFFCYIGETSRHFKTRIEEHIKKDTKSHIFKRLHSTTVCFNSYDSLSFEIIDKAYPKFDLKIKEAVDISWRKPDLSTQKSQLALTLSLKLVLPIFSFPFLFFPFSFIYYFFIFETNYRHLFCFNYTSPLLHLIITHFVNKFDDKFVVNICPRQLLWFM